jgi:hypothetical protein
MLKVNEVLLRLGAACPYHHASGPSQGLDAQADGVTVRRGGLHGRPVRWGSMGVMCVVK